MALGAPRKSNGNQVCGSRSCDSPAVAVTTKSERDRKNRDENQSRAAKSAQCKIRGRAFARWRSRMGEEQRGEIRDAKDGGARRRSAAARSVNGNFRARTESA